MGRNYNEDHYGFLRPLMERAREDWGLLEVCRQAGCESSRGSIRNWLDGRVRTSKQDDEQEEHKEEEPVKRLAAPARRPVAATLGRRALPGGSDPTLPGACRSPAGAAFGVKWGPGRRGSSATTRRCWPW